MTFCGAKPVTWKARCTMASSGLLTTITTELGLDFFTSVATAVMILALVPRRSSRLIPGLRAIPADLASGSRSLDALG